MCTCNDTLLLLLSQSSAYASSDQQSMLLQGLPIDEGAPMMAQFEDTQPCSLDEVGTPVLELFLKKDANGDMQRQGTVLSIPPEILSQAQTSMGKLQLQCILSSSMCVSGPAVSGCCLSVCLSVVQPLMCIHLPPYKALQSLQNEKPTPGCL